MTSFTTAALRRRIIRLVAGGRRAVGVLGEEARGGFRLTLWRLKGRRRGASFPLASSAIRSVYYDRGARRLEVEFRNGGTYGYVDVPPRIFRRLVGARSAGAFFNRHVRPSYEGGRVVTLWGGRYVWIRPRPRRGRVSPAPSRP